MGTHIFVAVKGTDGVIYINHADLGRVFNSFWSPAGFVTNVPPAVVGVGNNVYVFAKHPDGRIFYNRAVLGKLFKVGPRLMEDAAPTPRPTRLFWLISSNSN